MIWDALDLYILDTIYECSIGGAEVTNREMAKDFDWGDKENWMKKQKNKGIDVKEQHLEKRYCDSKEALIISRIKKMSQEGIVSITETPQSKIVTVLSSKVKKDMNYKFPDKKSPALLIKEKSGWIILQLVKA